MCQHKYFSSSEECFSTPIQLAGNIFDKFAKTSILVSGQVLHHKEGGGWVWYYEVACVSETHHPVGRVWL